MKLALFAVLAFIAAPACADTLTIWNGAIGIVIEGNMLQFNMEQPNAGFEFNGEVVGTVARDKIKGVAFEHERYPWEVIINGTPNVLWCRGSASIVTGGDNIIFMDCSE